MDVGSLILLQRRSLELEQGELARRLGKGLSRPVLSRIERGRRRVSPEELARILSALEEPRKERAE